MRDGTAHCGKFQPWAESPELYKKAGRASHINKPVNSVPPWPLLQFLPLGSSTEFPSQWTCKQYDKLFLHQLAFGPSVYHSRKEETHTHFSRFVLVTYCHNSMFHSNLLREQS